MKSKFTRKNSWTTKKFHFRRPIFHNHHIFNLSNLHHLSRTVGLVVRSPGWSASWREFDPLMTLFDSLTLLLFLNSWYKWFRIYSSLCVIFRLYKFWIRHFMAFNWVSPWEIKIFEKKLNWGNIEFLGLNFASIHLLALKHE